jgi:hypothetical protein
MPGTVATSTRQQMRHRVRWESLANKNAGADAAWGGGMGTGALPRRPGRLCRRQRSLADRNVGADAAWGGGIGTGALPRDRFAVGGRRRTPRC